MEGVKESLSLEQSERAAGEKDELKRLTNQVELERLTNQGESTNKQRPPLRMSWRRGGWRSEQDSSKSTEDELTVAKCKQEELSNFRQQMMGDGDTFLRSRQEHKKAEQCAVGEERMQGKQGADAKELQASGSCKSSSTYVKGHDRLVERLLKKIKQPPISPPDCDKFVQRLRASRGGLSEHPMEVIEEVRRMALAMEEVGVKAKKCLICFDPMVSKLLHCKQCQQAFHSRCWNEWAHQSKKSHPAAAECPVGRTSHQ